MMKSSLDTNQLKRQFYGFIHRYHFVIFVVTVIGGMVVVMFMLNSTIQSSTDTDTLTPTSAPSTGFDQETIEKLDQLKMDSKDTKQLSLPSSGRINPFVE